MRCLKCGYEESKVIDSRPTEDSNAIRRRRECMKCEFRFTTYEKIENIPIMVIKRNGMREAFDRDKVINGILRACEKRPISIDTIEKIADDLETHINNSLLREIETEEIGRIISEKLKQIDDIAYVRFASVYKQFKDINEFKEELNKLLK
ncbi:MAG: transcriptional regulator NrdR [Clostridia bacterium]|nr:transcriptional regulator NrdR [Clostridia bacterium]